MAPMAVTVRLPTLLRCTPTAPATVEASGATVGEVFADLTSRFPGLADQLVDGDGRPPQVRERLPERRRHPVPRPARHQGRRRRHHLDPPGGRRRLSERAVRHDDILGLIGDTPLVGIHELSPNPDVRIFAKLEGQNPGGSSKDRIALKMVELAEKEGVLHAGRHDPRTVVGQHRHRARARRASAAGTGCAWSCPRTCRSSGASCSRSSAPRSCSRRARRAATARSGCRRRSRPTTRRCVRAVPVRQPGEPARALRGHRARDLARLPRGRRVRRRPRHERHAHGRRPLPEGAQPGGAGGRGRAAVGRARAGPAQPRGRVRPADLRPRRARPEVHRAAARVDRVAAPPARRVPGVRGHLVGRGGRGRGEDRGRDGRRARSSRCCPTAGGSTSRRARGPTTSTWSSSAPRRSTTGSVRMSVPTDAEIARAADVLRGGGLVAFPTETVYGLGADASSPAALRRLYAVKGRPADHPVIVHLASARRSSTTGRRRVRSDARALADACWPGPLTLVARRARPRVPDEVTGGSATGGVARARPAGRARAAPTRSAAAWRRRRRTASVA